MTASATAKKKKKKKKWWPNHISCSHKFWGVFRSNKAIAFTQEKLQDQRKSHLTEPKRALVSQDLGPRLFWNVYWVFPRFLGPLPTEPHHRGFLAEGTICKRKSSSPVPSEHGHSTQPLRTWDSGGASWLWSANQQTASPARWWCGAVFEGLSAEPFRGALWSHGSRRYS